MQILKKIFLDNHIRFFTSSQDLHYLSKLHIFQTEYPSTQWQIQHGISCQGIVTQIFYPTENETLEVILPDSIIHQTPQQTVISFSQPQEGLAFLVCPQVVGKLNWKIPLDSLNGGLP